MRSFKLEHQILVNIGKLSQNMMVANFPKVLHALSALSQRSIHAESRGMAPDLRANRSKSQTTNYTQLKVTRFQAKPQQQEYDRKRREHNSKLNSDIMLHDSEDPGALDDEYLIKSAIGNQMAGKKFTLRPFGKSGSLHSLSLETEGIKSKTSNLNMSTRHSRADVFIILKDDDNR